MILPFKMPCLLPLVSHDLFKLISLPFSKLSPFPFYVHLKQFKGLDSRLSYDLLFANIIKLKQYKIGKNKWRDKDSQYKMKILNDAYNIIHINYSYAEIYSKNKKYL